MIGAIDSSGNRINVPVSYGYNFLPFIQDGRALSMQRPPKTVLLFDGHPGAATSGYWWGATVTCAPGPDGTVTICHKPGTPAEQILQIPPPALGGHMGHDDYCGPCGGGASANLQRISAANYPALRHLEKLNVIFFDCHGEVLSALPDDGFNF